jgi:hypothetical protein
MKYSKRARIFAEVLEYINNDDWDRPGNFLVFGMNAFEEYTGAVVDEPSDFDDLTRILTTKVKANRGDRSVRKRVSLHPLPADKTQDNLKDWLAGLPKPLLNDLWKAFSKDSFTAKPVVRAPNADEDDRDAALAGDAIRYLEDSMARLSTFDDVEIERESVQNAEYFDEAHRCDLFGLKIASAVLCRAVLEDSLKQTIDPKKIILGKIPKSAGGKKKSYMLTMIDEAGAKSRLDRERVKAAKRIKEAGDTAIHSLPEFRAKYAGCMHDIVDDTRKVLIDLFARK